MNGLALIEVGVQALGWCLVHFLWQGALIGALYALLRVVLPRGNARYVIAMLALLVLAACPIVTAWHEFQILAQPVDLGKVVVGASSSAAAPIAGVSRGDTMSPLRVALPWLVLAWMCGVVFLGARLLRQWLGLRTIVRCAKSSPIWQARARQFSARLGLGRAARVLASAKIATPTLVGWLRPVVVLPTAMLVQMPAEQVDLILAHELAHLRRLDHFANLFQVVLETLFFYHPVVHWISRDARNERELCCDALALRAAGGQPRDFVAALAGLEEFRVGHANLALAATGGVLVERAWFIAGVEPQRRHRRFGVAVIVALATLCVALGMAWRQAAIQQRVHVVLAANAAALNRNLVSLAKQATRPSLIDIPSQQQRLAPVSPAAARSFEQPAITVMPINTRVGLPGLQVPGLGMSASVAPVAAIPVPPRATTERVDVPAHDTIARVMATVRPAYPQSALMMGLQGEVVVGFTLGADGVPRDPHIVASSSRQFDAAALDAIAQWRFAPSSTTTGREYRQTFTFQLGATTSNPASARGCLVTTGTHICRHTFEPDPVMQVLHPAH